MGNISAMLLNYSSRTALHKAIDSLFLLGNQLIKVSVISNSIPEIELKKLNKNFHLEHVKPAYSDLGAAINDWIPSVSSDYVMFLYDQDFLADEIRNLTLQLHDKHSVLTHSYHVQGVTLERAFLVRTSRLKQGPLFYTSDQVPFAEAVLPAWLSQLRESEVGSLSEQVIKQVQKSHRINDRYCAEFIRLLQPKSEKQLGSQSTPSLTVLLSTYNMGRYIETALNSLISQTEQADQILLIDDGSTDDTPQRLHKWQNTANLLMLRTENGGKAKALNQLLPHVKSEFVLELDADDWLDPHALSVIRDLVRDLPVEVDLLYGNWRIWKQHTSGTLWCKGIQFGKQITVPEEVMDYPLPLGPRIYRTKSLLEIGGFPVIPFAEGKLYEDVLAIRKLMKQGQIRYEDFTVYNVREHLQSVTKVNLQKWKEFKEMLNM